MKVLFEGKEYEFGETLKVRELLQKMHLNPEEVVVLKNKRPLTDDEVLQDKDEIEIILIVSRG